MDSAAGEAVMIKYERQQQRRSEAPAAIWVRQLPSQGLSYQVWPAAAALCGYLEAKYGGGMAGLSVLELGSGVGMVGLLAACLGARVVLTDLPEVVANLRHNVAANEAAVRAGGGDATVLPLRWGVDDDAGLVTSDWGVPDLVLASDVVYYDHLFQPLLETLKSLLLPGRDGLLLLAHLRRWKKDSRFFKQAQKAFEVELVHTEAPAEGARRGVDIYAMVRRVNKGQQSVDIRG